MMIKCRILEGMTELGKVEMTTDNDVLEALLLEWRKTQKLL